MRFLLQSTALLFAFGLFSACGSLQACPLCKEAISSPGSDEDEINNAPAAYNTSIYLMVGVPYLLLGSVGFFIYRGCQRNAEHLQQLTQPAAPGADDPFTGKADRNVCPTDESTLSA